MRLALFAVTALCVSSLAAHASPITYNINETVGSSTAFGTIQTDGTLGVLSRANITGYQLTLTSGAQSETFSYADFVEVVGTDLTATNSGLFFNFSGTNPAGFFLPNASATSDLCFIDSITPCDGDESSEHIHFQGTFTDTTRTGTQEIATAATPEPSSFALLGTGLLGVAGMVRKRFA